MTGRSGGGGGGQPFLSIWLWHCIHIAAMFPVPTARRMDVIEVHASSLWNVRKTGQRNKRGAAAA